MRKLIFIQIIFVIAVFSSFMSLASVSESKIHYNQMSERRELPVLSGDESSYVGADNVAYSPIIIPDKAKSNTEVVAFDELRARILGNRYELSAETLCNDVAVDMEQYSKEASESTGAAYMVKILSIQLIADYRKVFPLPKPGEKVAVLQCRAQIQYSVNVEATTEFYLMVDSDGNNRVRWVPDNSTSKVINQ